MWNIFLQILSYGQIAIKKIVFSSYDFERTNTSKKTIDSSLRSESLSKISGAEMPLTYWIFEPGCGSTPLANRGWEDRPRTGNEPG